MLSVSVENSISVHSPLQDNRMDAPIKITIRSNLHDTNQEEDLSPISLKSSSCIPDTVGDCCICYEALPIRTNHIFTVCGHLFCVKCLFNWNYSSATCPMCRKSLYENVFIPEGGVFNMDNDVNDAHASVDNDFVDEGVGNMTDSYIYDDDGIYWTTFVNSDDEVIPISEREIAQLRQVRSLMISIIRRKNYLDSLSLRIRFTGEIIHTFIPRVDYIPIRNNAIGLDHLYEFVLCKNTFYDGDEMNFFGHIIQITLGDGHSEDSQRNSNWENTHECCFIVDVFNPNWGGSYNEETGVITYERMRFRFSAVRRVYSVRAVSV